MDHGRSCGDRSDAGALGRKAFVGWVRTWGARGGNIRAGALSSRSALRTPISCGRRRPTTPNPWANQASELPQRGRRARHRAEPGASCCGTCCSSRSSWAACAHPEVGAARSTLDLLLYGDGSSPGRPARASGNSRAARSCSRRSSSSSRRSCNRRRGGNMQSPSQLRHAAAGERFATLELRPA